MQLEDQQHETFLRLLTPAQPRVYAFILSLVPNRADADEILQDTNVVLWQRFAEFQPGSSFRAWAFQVAHFRVQKFLERRGRSPVGFSQEFLETVATTAQGRLDDYDLRQAALADCLTQLGQRDRALIEARYQPDATVAGLAEQTQRTTHAVYKALERIRRRLQECVSRKLLREAHG